MMVLVAAPNATPDRPTTTLRGDLAHAIFRHTDIVAQARIAFRHRSVYLQARDDLLPKLTGALFNYNTPDLVLNRLVAALCEQPLYDTVLLRLVRRAIDQQIVRLHDRLQTRP